MILPERITGFFEMGRGGVHPDIDHAWFLAACHAVARSESGRVERFEPSGVARNYHRAILRPHHATIMVLCNAHFPFIAFAEASDDLPLRFIKAQKMGLRFQELMACQIVTLTSLEAHPDEEFLVNLAGVERDQIRYWRPQRLGEIIFNGWD